MDSAAKNYPGTMRDQNKYDTFDIMANPTVGGAPTKAKQMHAMPLGRTWWPLCVVVTKKSIQFGQITVHFTSFLQVYCFERENILVGSNIIHMEHN